jgi:hypothetical protein
MQKLPDREALSPSALARAGAVIESERIEVAGDSVSNRIRGKWSRYQSGTFGQPQPFLSSDVHFLSRRLTSFQKSCRCGAQDALTYGVRVSLCAVWCMLYGWGSNVLSPIFHSNQRPWAPARIRLLFAELATSWSTLFRIFCPDRGGTHRLV